MLALLPATSAIAEKVRLAVTSSFHNSGLSDHIIPYIETDLEIDIQHSLYSQELEIVLSVLQL